MPSQALVAPQKHNIAGPGSALNIYVPGTPARLHISGDELQYLMLNPVIAVEKVMGLQLDEFQKADLKTAWRTPFVMDSSGVSSSKSLRMWIITNLRCMLIPDHVALIYYPFFGTGQSVFWSNYTMVANRAPLFATQIGQLGVEGEKTGKSTLKKASEWVCYYRNGSVLRMPAGGFDRNSISQAGQRSNTIGIDEFTKIESTGSTGIDDQILLRNTRHCFNKNHPIWGNHVYLLATAEDTMHPAYDRYMVFKREVERGNPSYALINRCFKDYSTRMFDGRRTHQAMWRHDIEMRDAKKRMSPAKYSQEVLGIWGKTGRGWYTRDMLDACREAGKRRNVQTITSAKSDPAWNSPRMTWVKYFAGIDPAKSQDAKAANGAIVIARATPRLDVPTAEAADWWFDFVYAYKVRKAEVDQWSGLIHRKELDFGLSMIMMDYGGGGDWIRGFLKKPTQVIRNKQVEVKSIACIEDEALVESDAIFNLAMFKPKDQRVEKLYADQTRQHESNLIDFSHQELKTALDKQWVGLPPRSKEVRQYADYEEWSEERKHASEMVDMMCSEWQRICVRTENNGSIFLNGHQAREFSAKGRKDFAYAGMYAYIGFLCWLKNFADEIWLGGLQDEPAAGGGGQSVLGSVGGSSPNSPSDAASMAVNTLPGIPGMPSGGLAQYMTSVGA